MFDGEPFSHQQGVFFQVGRHCGFEQARGQSGIAGLNGIRSGHQGRGQNQQDQHPQDGAVKHAFLTKNSAHSGILPFFSTLP